MSRSDPAPDCFDLGFQAAYPIDEPGEVALEDYARALFRARAAEGVRAEDDPLMIRAVHVCGMGCSPTPALMTDLEDFARSLVTRTNGGGLGWT
jgi:hypothetical protein